MARRESGLNVCGYPLIKKISLNYVVKCHVWESNSVFKWLIKLRTDIFLHTQSQKILIILKYTNYFFVTNKTFCRRNHLAAHAEKLRMWDHPSGNCPIVMISAPLPAQQRRTQRGERSKLIYCSALLFFPSSLQRARSGEKGRRNFFIRTGAPFIRATLRLTTRNERTATP